MLSLEDIHNLTYTTTAARCGGCANNCMLTVNVFPGGRRHVTGNRCEKGLGGRGAAKDVPNLFAYKRQRLFDYAPLEEQDAPRGVIGIPRVLNLYENFPFWATFFRKLGFRVVLSPFSDRNLYGLGMESIPSESECYPAKLAHGHVQWLVEQGVKTIFHPCVFYEKQETPAAQNHFNCPIVVSYPENLKNNVEAVADGDVRYIRPFMAFTSEKIAADLGVSPSECLMIGDSDIDLLTAQNAGMAHIGVTWGFRSEEFLRDRGVQCFAHTPAQLEALITAMGGGRNA